LPGCVSEVRGPAFTDGRMLHCHVDHICSHTGNAVPNSAISFLDVEIPTVPTTTTSGETNVLLLPPLPVVRHSTRSKIPPNYYQPQIHSSFKLTWEEPLSRNSPCTLDRWISLHRQTMM